MKITFYEKVQLAVHIERKIADMNINNSEIKEKVYADVERQIKREFGLNRKHPALKRKYLYEAHELIDNYEPPLHLQELIKEANAQITLDV